MTTLTKLLFAIGAAVILLWHPLTRRIVMVILRLGKGIDDILFWVLLATFILVAFVKGWVSIPKIKRFFNKLEREENE